MHMFLYSDEYSIVGFGNGEVLKLSIEQPNQSTILEGTNWGHAVTTLEPFANDSSKFLVGFQDGTVMKWDNGFTKLQGQ